MLKVVKVLHLSQLHTHNQREVTNNEQQVGIKIQNLQNIHAHQTDRWEGLKQQRHSKRKQDYNM